MIRGELGRWELFCPACLCWVFCVPWTAACGRSAPAAATASAAPSQATLRAPARRCGVCDDRAQSRPGGGATSAHLPVEQMACGRWEAPLCLAVRCYASRIRPRGVRVGLGVVRPKYFPCLRSCLLSRRPRLRRSAPANPLRRRGFAARQFPRKGELQVHICQSSKWPAAEGNSLSLSAAPSRGSRVWKDLCSRGNLLAAGKPLSARGAPLRVANSAERGAQAFCRIAGHRRYDSSRAINDCPYNASPICVKYPCRTKNIYDLLCMISYLLSKIFSQKF